MVEENPRNVFSSEYRETFNLTLLKKTPTQVLSCEYCEIDKSNFFYRTLQVAASVNETSNYAV